MRNLRFTGCAHINIIVLIFAVIALALAFAFLAFDPICIILPAMLQSAQCITSLHRSSSDSEDTLYYGLWNNIAYIANIVRIRYLYSKTIIQGN
jgi:hypothetical protein